MGHEHGAGLSRPSWGECEPWFGQGMLGPSRVQLHPTWGAILGGSIESIPVVGHGHGAGGRRAGGQETPSKGPEQMRGIQLHEDVGTRSKGFR